MRNQHLAAAGTAIERSVAGLTPEVLAREVPGHWSIAEILEHLTLAFRANAAALEKALASGELRARRATLKAALIRTLVIDVGYFPRATAPKMTTPSRSIPPEQSISAILDALVTLDATIARTSERFGDSVLVVNHPYFMGLTVPQWCKFHWRHTVHHMKQVRKRRAES